MCVNTWFRPDGSRVESSVEASRATSEAAVLSTSDTSSLWDQSLPPRDMWAIHRRETWGTRLAGIRSTLTHFGFKLNSGAIIMAAL